MKSNRLYAVITGDIVGSSKIKNNQRSHLLSLLKSTFCTMEKIIPGRIQSPFEIHRGDSFQGVLSNPEDALRIVILIRTSLRYGFKIKQSQNILDARIAAGIGKITFLPSGRGSEGDGEAFWLSGPILDKMKGDKRLVIRTPWEEINSELDVECALLDALINRWSAEQAQAINGKIKNLTQEQIARQLGISQPAVRQRLKRAGSWAVEELCSRYEQLIQKTKNIEV